MKNLFTCKEKVVPILKKNLKMKLSVLFTFIMVFALQANTSFGQRNVTLDVKKTTIAKIIDEIEANTDYKFIFKTSVVDLKRKISIKVKEEKIEKVLQKLFKNTATDYEVMDNKILLSVTKQKASVKKTTRKKALQQRIKITGKITDEAGQPLPNVTVRIKGTNRATASTFDGLYTINAISSDNTLVFTSIGFEKQEVVIGNQTTINITLKVAVGQLDEIVINAGYYNTTKKEATGSISTITAKTIEKQPVNNPLGAMQGHMTGVNITQNSGLPGGGFSIEIRGQNFLTGGTDPLYIIDGVPYGSESLELVGVNYNKANPLNMINPADIKDIQVLKDADATAIYGSRGANGVVLITTKKGKIGKPRIDVTVSSTISQVSRKLDLVNTQQYLELYQVALDPAWLANPAFDPYFPELKLWDQNRYTDWQKELLGGTAYRNNANLSFSGGSDQTQFLIGGNFGNETTVLPGDTNYKRGSIRSNINHQSKDQRFKVSLTMNYGFSENNLSGGSGNIIKAAYNLAPNAPALYDAEGNLFWGENQEWNVNPLRLLKEEYQGKEHTININSNVSYKLNPSLELKMNMGYTDYQLSSYKTSPNTIYNPAFNTTASLSRITNNSGSRKSWIVEPQLNWKQQWGEAGLNILVGSTFQKDRTTKFSQSAENFSSNILIHNLLAAQKITTTLDSDSEYAYQAIYGRVNFNWKKKYILNLIGRRDGSSRFGLGKRFGNFAAVGAAWLFSKEDFLKDNEVISFGKLRGSYGTTGSDNIGDYQFLDTYDLADGNYGGVSILQPTGIFNKNYAWEENRKLELALELGFLKDRILLNTAWYQNRSSNQLVGIPLAGTTGFTSLTGNYDAVVENTGLEIDFRSINIQKQDFKWSTTFNISLPKTKLVAYDDIENSVFSYRRVGESLYEKQGYHYLGVNPNTGEHEFEDYNNDGVINSFDRKHYVDMGVKFYGGLGNSFTYKNFSLDFFFLL
ncbi:SusC/RagA family TonB-linked outer membrane protein [Polaribacter porphyrae]|uniref:SusC/RagA family TonB-linked outer membrane protein n=1 Tax=Polaribacter porphyrae TaxID=1137780 RepID=UPI000CF4AB7C|nr:SusC/RagA family TonB-linked outer membrane protein [Polaribacter porphyrae]